MELNLCGNLVLDKGKFSSIVSQFHLKVIILPIHQVTTSGQFVCTWNSSSGKLPFERIIFARYGQLDKKQLLLPDGKLVVSVPCAIHSFKPPLERLLRPYVSEENKCLELFARSLLPDTVSWGDQVPLLQHKSLFEETNQVNS